MWAALAAIAGSIIGSKSASKSASKASNAQVQAARMSIKSQERMFNRSLSLQEPYRNAGYGAIGSLQGMTDPAQRAQMLNDYYNSNEYGMMENQAQQSTLRSAAATGNLRGGAGAQAIANIAPQLGMQYLNNQTNQFTGLANLGMGAASQGANSASNLGLSLSNQYNNIGDAQAQKYLTQGNIWGNLAGQLGGMGANMAKSVGGGLGFGLGGTY